MTQSNDDDAQRLPLGFIPPTVRPTIRVDDGDINQATKLVWKHLIKSNRRSVWLFRVPSGFQWIERDGKQILALIITKANLKFVLGEHFIFQRHDNRGQLRVVDPPTALVEALFATPNNPLSVLKGIYSTPVLGPVGGLVCTPGYNHDTGIFYFPRPGFTLPAISEAPSTAEIAAAGKLLRDLLCDFPILSSSGFAHIVATMLTAILRPAINGPVPLLVIGKPAPGSGATLLANIIVEIVLGTPASIMVEGGNESEMRKRITAALMQLPVFQLIDNLHGPLRSPALAALLTSTVWRDRTLGHSHVIDLPNTTIWMVTGNNPVLSDEIARRAIWVRLDAQSARPWEGRSFRDPRIIDTVRQDRSAFLGALFTMAQAWIVRGRPLGKRRLAGFEEWSGIVGGVLEVAGIPGFLQQHHASNSDPDEVAVRQLVATWLHEFENAEVGVYELYGIVRQMDIPLNLGDGSERSQRTRLGLAIQRLRDRTFDIDGHLVAVRAEDSHQHAARWRLADVRTQPKSQCDGGRPTPDDRVDPGGRVRGREFGEPCELSIIPEEGHRSMDGADVSPEGSQGSSAFSITPDSGTLASPGGPAKPNRGRSIVALDLGSQTGWAARLRTGAIISDSESLTIGRHMSAGAKFLELSRLLGQIETRCDGIDLLVLEDVMSHKGTIAAQMYGGFVATIVAWCDNRGISYAGVPVGTIKKFATGHGNASKPMMVEFARSKGIEVKDHNQADALALLFWAVEHYK